MVYFSWSGFGYLNALNTADHAPGGGKKVNKKKRQADPPNHKSYIKQAIESSTYNPLYKTH